MSTSISRPPITATRTLHRSDHQNVAISQSKCDSVQVPRASSRYTYAMITPTMPRIANSGANITNPDPITPPIAVIANRA